MMAGLKTYAFLLMCVCAGLQSTAQSNAAFASTRAMAFADSLVHSFQASDWEKYIRLSYPGFIEYYGGKTQFREYTQRARIIAAGSAAETTTLELVQIKNEGDEWQALVKKNTTTKIDGKAAVIVSFLIGQSKDGGSNWQYADIDHNSPDNVVYIMPDIFPSISIPQRQIVYEAFASTTSNPR